MAKPKVELDTVLLLSLLVGGGYLLYRLGGDETSDSATPSTTPVPSPLPKATTGGDPLAPSH